MRKNNVFKVRKILTHRFFDRWTIPGVIVLVLLGILIGQVAAGSIGTFLSASFFGTGNNIPLTGSFIGGAFGSFLILSLYWRLFYPQFHGCLPGVRIRYWLIFAAAASLVLLAVAVLMILVQKPAIGVPPLVNLSAALMAGCLEEALYRGIAISYLMRQWPGERGILPSMVTSSAIFALAHFMNILNGASFGVTVYQVFCAFCIGMFLSAVFLRCGSIWPCVIIHTLNDVWAFISVDVYAAGGTYSGNAELVASDYIFIVFLILATAFAVYMVRQKFRGEIAVLWKNKWS